MADKKEWSAIPQFDTTNKRVGAVAADSFWRSSSWFSPVPSEPLLSSSAPQPLSVTSSGNSMAAPVIPLPIVETNTKSSLTTRFGSKTTVESSSSLLDRQQQQLVSQQSPTISSAVSHNGSPTDTSFDVPKAIPQQYYHGSSAVISSSSRSLGNNSSASFSWFSSWGAKAQEEDGKTNEVGVTSTPRTKLDVAHSSHNRPNRAAEVGGATCFSRFTINPVIPRAIVGPLRPDSDDVTPKTSSSRILNQDGSFNLQNIAQREYEEKEKQRQVEETERWAKNRINSGSSGKKQTFVGNTQNKTSHVISNDAVEIAPASSQMSPSGFSSLPLAPQTSSLADRPQWSKSESKMMKTGYTLGREQDDVNVSSPMIFPQGCIQRTGIRALCQQTRERKQRVNIDTIDDTNIRTTGETIGEILGETSTETNINTTTTESTSDSLSHCNLLTPEEKRRWIAQQRLKSLAMKKAPSSSPALPTSFETSEELPNFTSELEFKPESKPEFKPKHAPTTTSTSTVDILNLPSLFSQRFIPKDKPLDSIVDTSSSGYLSHFASASGHTFVRERFHVENSSRDSPFSSRFLSLFHLQAETKDTLARQVIAPLRFPGIYASVGTTPSIGVLLTGPSGVGKTTVVKDLAAELGVYIQVVSIRDLLADPTYGFEQEKNDAPSSHNSRAMHMHDTSERASSTSIASATTLANIAQARCKQRMYGHHISKALRACEANAPSILLLDDLDGLGEQPAYGSSGVSQRHSVSFGATIVRDVIKTQLLEYTARLRARQLSVSTRFGPFASKLPNSSTTSSLSSSLLHNESMPVTLVLGTATNSSIFPPFFAQQGLFRTTVPIRPPHQSGRLALLMQFSHSLRLSPNLRPTSLPTSVPSSLPTKSSTAPSSMKQKHSFVTSSPEITPAPVFHQIAQATEEFHPGELAMLCSDAMREAVVEAIRMYSYVITSDGTTKQALRFDDCLDHSSKPSHQAFAEDLSTSLQESTASSRSIASRGLFGTDPPHRGSRWSGTDHTTPLENHRSLASLFYDWRQDEHHRNCVHSEHNHEHSYDVNTPHPMNDGNSDDEHLHSHHLHSSLSLSSMRSLANLQRIFIPVPSALPPNFAEKVEVREAHFLTALAQAIQRRAQTASFLLSASETTSGSSSSPFTVEKIVTTTSSSTFSSPFNSSTNEPPLWKSIGGNSQVKRKLLDIVEQPLLHPEVFRAYGLVPSAGVLLYGPAGCGKTLLAKGIAQKVKASFISVTAGQILSQYVGQSEANVRALFSAARSCAPTIVFIDEADALFCKRSTGPSGAMSDSTTDRLVAQFLTELDNPAGVNGGADRESRRKIASKKAKKDSRAASTVANQQNRSNNVENVDGEDDQDGDDIETGIEDDGEMKDDFLPSHSSYLDKATRKDQVSSSLSSASLCAQPDQKNIFVICATNRPEALDAALLRPGRLEHTLYVGLPDKPSRRDIILRQLKACGPGTLASDVTKQTVLKMASEEYTQGWTGADITHAIAAAKQAVIKRVIAFHKRRSRRAGIKQANKWNEKGGNNRRNRISALDLDSSDDEDNDGGNSAKNGEDDEDDSDWDLETVSQIREADLLSVFDKGASSVDIRHLANFMQFKYQNRGFGPISSPLKSPEIPQAEVDHRTLLSKLISKAKSGVTGGDDERNGSTEVSRDTETTQFEADLEKKHKTESQDTIWIEDEAELITLARHGLVLSAHPQYQLFVERYAWVQALNRQIELQQREADFVAKRKKNKNNDQDIECEPTASES